MAKCLAGLGLAHSLDSGKDAPEGPKWLVKHKKVYQCLIASKWPIVPVDDKWRKGAPYPEVLGRAMIKTTGGRRSSSSRSISPMEFQQWLVENRHLQRLVGGASRGERLSTNPER